LLSPSWPQIFSSSLRILQFQTLVTLCFQIPLLLTRHPRSRFSLKLSFHASFLRHEGMLGYCCACSSPIPFIVRFSSFIIHIIKFSKDVKKGSPKKNLKSGWWRRLYCRSSESKLGMSATGVVYRSTKKKRIQNDITNVTEITAARYIVSAENRNASFAS
jgi:hypothetical protein